jgi:hypothetical protein
VLGDAIAERPEIEVVPKVFSRAQNHWGDGDVHLVHQPSAKVLTNGRSAATETDVA